MIFVGRLLPRYTYRSGPLEDRKLDDRDTDFEETVAVPRTLSPCTPTNEPLFASANPDKTSDQELMMRLYRKNLNIRDGSYFRH